MIVWMKSKEKQTKLAEVENVWNGKQEEGFGLYQKD